MANSTIYLGQILFMERHLFAKDGPIDKICEHANIQKGEYELVLENTTHCVYPTVSQVSAKQLPHQL